MREGTFLDFEGKELKDFEKAVEYHSQTGLDVFIWWEVLNLEPPVNGWDDDKDGICSVESCWGKIRKSKSKAHCVSCVNCPRSYHLSCISIVVSASIFNCSLLGKTCTTRLTPILK